MAQYGLFSTYNHYDEYFRKFQRNNGEIGVSFQLPILPGPGVKAQAAIAEDDAAHLRIEKNQLQSRIALDIHRALSGRREGAGLARTALRPNCSFGS